MKPANAVKKEAPTVTEPAPALEEEEEALLEAVAEDEWVVEEVESSPEAVEETWMEVEVEAAEQT